MEDVEQRVSGDLEVACLSFCSLTGRPQRIKLHLATFQESKWKFCTIEAQHETNENKKVLYYIKEMFAL